LLNDLHVAKVFAMELKRFLKAATLAEREKLARVCNDSVGYLYQLAGGHRYASPLLATHIEEASGELASQSEGRLEAVPRATLVRHPEIFQGLGSEARIAHSVTEGPVNPMPHRQDPAGGQ
jgi:hypothetical protein